MNPTPILKAIAAGALTRAAASEALQCSPRTVNRLMRKYGIVKPPGRRALARAKAASKARVLQLIRGKTPQEALLIAKAYQLSPSMRTIYRWLRR